MTETATGPIRLKGLLPPVVVVAYKTGTSGEKDGLGTAINDAGIIFMPGGQQLAVVVLVTNSRANEKTREGVIAQITRLVYDHELRRP